MIPLCPDCACKEHARYLGLLYSIKPKSARIPVRRGYTHLLSQIPADAKRALAKAFRAGRVETSE